MKELLSDTVCFLFETGRKASRWQQLLNGETVDSQRLLENPLWLEGHGTGWLGVLFHLCAAMQVSIDLTLVWFLSVFGFGRRHRASGANISLDFAETLFIPDSGNPKGIMESADSKVEEVTWQTRWKCKHGLEQEMLELGIWGYGSLDCIVRLKM